MVESPAYWNLTYLAMFEMLWDLYFLVDSTSLYNFAIRLEPAPYTLASLVKTYVCLFVCCNLFHFLACKTWLYLKVSVRLVFPIFIVPWMELMTRKSDNWIESSSDKQETGAIIWKLN